MDAIKQRVFQQTASIPKVQSPSFLDRASRSVTLLLTGIPQGLKWMQFRADVRAWLDSGEEVRFTKCPGSDSVLDKETGWRWPMKAIEYLARERFSEEDCG